MYEQLHKELLGREVLYESGKKSQSESYMWLYRTSGNTDKPSVIDRKNFLLANTPKEAADCAMIFSMIQTALENQLDPYRYLTWLLK